MKQIISYTRRKCAIGGCKRLCRNKGLYNGKTRYGRTCQLHHKQNDRKPYWNYRYEIPNKKCEVCGWNKSFCDRHRIIPKLGYTKENIKVLCPNCHRLVEARLLKVK